MKKLIALMSLVCITFALSAQVVQENIIKFGKQKVSGYTIELSSVDAATTEAALKERMDKAYSMKASKENGFRAYKAQPFSPFGLDTYNTYISITEKGKKYSKTTKMSVVVLTGNLTPIDRNSKPTDAENIKAFLTDFVAYAQNYALKLQENSLREEILNENQLSKDNETYRNNLTSATNLNPQTSAEKIYTMEEVKKMKPEEFRKNQRAILEQFVSHKLK